MIHKQTYRRRNHDNIHVRSYKGDVATARYWSAMERHKLYICEHGQDMPEVRDWRWAG